MKRLVVYADSATLGGHERMTVALVAALAAATRGTLEIVALVHSSVLGSALAEHVPVERVLPANSTPLPFLRNLAPATLRDATTVVRRFNPDCLLVPQGDIEQGLRGVLVGRRLGTRTVSYLPMAFSFVSMGSRLARVRDAIGARFYGLPDAFITIAEHQRRLLAARTRAPVAIVPNGIARPPRHASRGPGGPSLRIAVVGRVVFRHKQQHLIPPLARELAQRGAAVAFDVLGDGPDAGELARLVGRHGISDRVRLHGRVDADRVGQLMSEEVDALLMPSRFEGVPLVFLESAARALPAFVPRLPFVSDYPVPESLVLADTGIGTMADAIERFAHAREVPGVGDLARVVTEMHDEAATVDRVRAVAPLLLG